MQPMYYCPCSLRVAFVYPVYACDSIYPFITQKPYGLQQDKNVYLYRTILLYCGSTLLYSKEQIAVSSTAVVRSVMITHNGDIPRVRVVLTWRSVREAMKGSCPGDGVDCSAVAEERYQATKMFKRDDTAQMDRWWRYYNLWKC